MTRRVLATLALVGMLLPVAQLLAGPGDHLVSQTAVEGLGLTRSWATRADIDASRSRLTDLTLYENGLFVQSDRAMIHALNAETGKPLWVTGRQIGNPNFPTFTPGFNEFLAGVVNGTRLFLLNRSTGDVLWDKELPGSPVDGPALSDQRVYVPLDSGLIICHRIKPATDPLKDLKVRRSEEGEAAAPAEPPPAVAKESYKLSQEYITPMLIQALGTTTFRPVVMRQVDEEEFIAWSTRNKIVVCRVDRLQRNVFVLKYRVDMSADVSAPLIYLPNRSATADFGWLCGVAANGMVAMIDEKSGDTVWQFSANEPVSQPLIVTGESLYIVSQLGQLFAVDVASGKPKWTASGVSQFLAASKDRVFAADRAGGQLRIFDATNGRPLGAITAPGMTVRLSNHQTDRIYLASATGLIQSLREIQLTKPLVHAAPRRPAEKPSPKAKAAAKAAAEGEENGGAMAPDAAAAPEKPEKPAKPARKPAAKRGKDADQ